MFSRLLQGVMYLLHICLFQTLNVYSKYHGKPRNNFWLDETTIEHTSKTERKQYRISGDGVKRFETGDDCDDIADM